NFALKRPLLVLVSGHRALLPWPRKTDVWRRITSSTQGAKLLRKRETDNKGSGSRARRHYTSNRGARMLKFAAAVLTADRIDSWIRRHVVQYCCKNPSISTELNPTFVMTSAHATQFGIDEQMLGSE